MSEQREPSPEMTLDEALARQAEEDRAFALALEAGEITGEVFDEEGNEIIGPRDNESILEKRIDGTPTNPTVAA